MGCRVVSMYRASYEMSIIRYCIFHLKDGCFLNCSPYQVVLLYFILDNMHQLNRSHVWREKSLDKKADRGHKKVDEKLQFKLGRVTSFDEVLDPQLLATASYAVV